MAQLTAKTETNIESEFVKVLLYVRRDDGSYGGWRTELLEEEITNKIEAKFLLCCYCKGMLRDACLFEKDGKQELACSVCLPKDFLKQIARINAETINEKQVHCPFKTEGCDWTNELSELLHHLDECELFPVTCPLGCRDERGEVSRVERRRVETHRRCCPMRTVKCEYCSVSVKACDINGHLDVCEEFPIPCPNKCNKEFQVRRKDKSIHLSQECPLQETECPYSQYGCEAKVQRRNIEQHEKEDMHKHMKLTINMVSNVQSKIVTLEKENASFRTKIVNLEKENENLRKRDLEIQSSLTTISKVVLRGNLTWKISCVKDKITQKKSTYSEPFYVGLYKFQGCVKWNEENDQIGLLFFILKSGSDETLRWPIKYKSSIALINQLNHENNCHHEFEITDRTLEEEPKCFEKPKLFRNERGYGFPKFISQTDILKEKYCKDDSIELNISVELV